MQAAINRDAIKLLVEARRKAAAEKKANRKPAAEKKVAKKVAKAADEPAKRPAAKKPAAKAAEKPAAKKPAAKKEKPAAKKRTAEQEKLLERIRAEEETIEGLTEEESRALRIEMAAARFTMPKRCTALAVYRKTREAEEATRKYHEMLRIQTWFDRIHPRNILGVDPRLVVICQ